MTTTTPQFGTDEILWYDNGRWGQCGYAIANPNGKAWTNNSVQLLKVGLAPALKPLRVVVDDLVDGRIRLSVEELMRQ